MPFPLAIVAAVAVVSAVSSGVYAAYKYYADDDEPKKEPEDEVVNLGRFAIWGHPDVGKTTFINQLLEKPITTKKEQTSGKRIWDNIPIKTVHDKKYKINRITDMPGNDDRFNDWLNLVIESENIFYLVDLSKWCTSINNGEYILKVETDIERTIEVMSELDDKKKKLNIIFTHLDRSKWQDLLSSHVVNELNKEINIRKLYEVMKRGKVAGYVYAANLTSSVSFKKLVDDLISDSHA